MGRGGGKEGGVETGIHASFQDFSEESALKESMRFCEESSSGRKSVGTSTRIIRIARKILSNFRKMKSHILGRKKNEIAYTGAEKKKRPLPDLPRAPAKT